MAENKNLTAKFYVLLFGMYGIFLLTFYMKTLKHNVANKILNQNIIKSSLTL